jgi:hypothetical protein
MSKKTGISDSRAKTAQFALMVTFFTQGFATLSWLPRIPEFIDAAVIDQIKLLHKK